MGTGHDIDRRIAELAAVQHGVVARRQLWSVGVRSDAVARRVRAGTLVSLSPRVLRVAGAPPTSDARVMAAALDAHATAHASGETGAAMWRLPSFRIDPIDVTVEFGHGSESALARIHEQRRLDPNQVLELNGVPVASPSRVIFDLAGSARLSDKRVERALDHALARRLVSPASLQRVLVDLEGRGRRGIQLMRTLLHERGVNYVPPESSTEARFEALASQAGLRFDRQADVGGERGWLGRVDFRDPVRRLVVEVGDALFHGSLTDRRADEERWAALRGAGWVVEYVDGFDIYHGPAALIARLRALEVATRPTSAAA